MKPRTIEYASPSRRPRLPAWLVAGGPLILFAAGAAFYAASRWLRASGLTSVETFLNLRVALEGLAPLVLAAGVVWGIAAVIRARGRNRKAVALLGLALCAGALPYVFHVVFLSVKK